jgi:outer membrane receptor protein involved in Fe transport
MNKQWDEWLIEGKVNYAYTPVIKREGTHEWDTGTGKQVPYQPQHIANLTTKIEYKKICWQAGFHVVGPWHTSDRYDVIKAYTLLDLSAGYTFFIKSLSLLLSLQINNVIGVDYRSVKNYAMPGRNYAITLRCSF